MVLEGILSVFNPTTLAVIFIGVIVGIIFGSIPGLTYDHGGCALLADYLRYVTP